MVAVELAVRGAHQRPDREVEARGAELALVAAPGLPRKHAVRRAGVSQHRLHRAVYLGVPAAAALVRQAPVVANARQRQAVPHVTQTVAVLMQPSERSDRAGCEQEAVGVPQAPLHQLLGEHRGDDDSGQIVVRERGVAGVGRYKDLSIAFALDRKLRIGEVARLERRVDHHLVIARPAARAAGGARGRIPMCGRSRRSCRGSPPVGRAACAAARAARRAVASSAPARCTRPREGRNVGSRRRGCRRARRCRRRGCSTPPARSNRTPSCRSGSRSA